MGPFAELSEKQDRIDVHFPYNPGHVSGVKAIPGARFIPKDKGGPYWKIPLDLVSARRMREVFKGDLTLGQGLTAWGRDAVVRERNLRTLVTLDSLEPDELELNAKIPELAKWFRPYQRADTKFLATTNTINANEQGLGKTSEIVAAIYEAGLENGPHLVVAPKTSLDVVWRYEFERWTDIPVVTYSGDATKSERERMLADVMRWYGDGTPFVFVCTPYAVRSGLIQQFIPAWNTFTIDEFHKHGLTNISGDPNKGTQFGQACMKIEAERKWLVSGTPIGGKPIKLWGALRFLHPESFTSKWRWAENWLVVTTNPFGHKEIGGLKPERVEEFYSEHARYMVRRLKSEVLKQLPPKMYIDVPCPMTKKQAKQYKEFAEAAEIRIDEERLTAKGVLAEYARLKMFAFSYCDVERLTNVKKCPECKGTGLLGEETCDICLGTGKTDHLKLKPTADGGKLEPLVDRLAEVGIDPADPTGDSVAVIGSQHKEVIDFLTTYLNSIGIKTEKITGDTKQKDRARIMQAFQGATADSPRVIAITTTAGGVAITLDRADTMHIMDETWTPDDQVQLEDRIHRASRMHQVTIYNYRTPDTVETEIGEVTTEKGAVNEAMLDTYRQNYKAKKGAK